jgi:hypothetical protein
MSDINERRRRAIGAAQVRNAQEKADEADGHAKELAASLAIRERAQRWTVTTTALIVSAVAAVNDTYARDGSPLALMPVPLDAVDLVAPVGFEIRPSGSLDASGWLRFSLGVEDGIVHAESDADTEELPGDISLDELTVAWIETITDAAMMATLQG